MRRVALIAVFTAAVVVVVRALVPRLHSRLLVACERMFEEMPESFPPKRMMRGIEEINVNSARALELLEEREALETASSNEGSSPQTVRAP